MAATTRPPYDPEDLLSINTAMHCTKLEKSVAFMACPACQYYPCQQLTGQDIVMLQSSPLMQITGMSIKKRRCQKMYIAHYYDGAIAVLENFDEKHVTPEQLTDVKEIFVVTKVLVPVLTLKPKPKEDREAVKAKAKSRAKSKPQAQAA